MPKKSNHMWLIIGAIAIFVLIGLAVAMIAGVGLWFWLTPSSVTTGPTPLGPQVMPFHLDSSNYHVYEGAGDTCDFEIDGSVQNIHDTPMTGVKVSCFFIRGMEEGSEYNIDGGSYDVGTVGPESEADISFKVTLDKYTPSDDCWEYIADCDLEYTL